MITRSIPVRPMAPFPNSARPVLLYSACLAVHAASADAFVRLFESNGWGGTWVNGVYTFDHFHAGAHEVLGCARGWIILRLGGPEGITYRIGAGDGVLLPAGVGHCRIAASSDYQIVGAYPPGQAPDLRRGDDALFYMLAAQAQSLPRPPSDPVGGREGPCMSAWQP